jgi:hypothetical protein
VVYQAPDGNPITVFSAGARHGSADVRRLMAAGFTSDQAEAVVMVGRFPRTIDADKATVLATLAEAKAQAAADMAKRRRQRIWPRAPCASCGGRCWRLRSTARLSAC